MLITQLGIFTSIKLTSFDFHLTKENYLNLELFQVQCCALFYIFVPTILFLCQNISIRSVSREKPGPPRGLILNGEIFELLQKIKNV